jgi:hydroxymethylbilane synthase
MRLRAATRGSPLALWQVEHVASLLADVEVEPVVVQTEGDRRSEAPLWELGGKGVFVKEVQAAVLDGRADFAVHSAKDLPSVTVEGLVLAAVPERGEPRDALVGSTLDDLPTGGLVATGSVRRRAQLADRRPDLTFTGLRGNIATRLAKADQYAAIVMAAAALQRLGLADRATEVLDPVVMLPQVGQGALAVEARADDGETLAVLGAVEHRLSRMAVDAERAFLAELGGDCDLPAGAYAVADDGGVRVEALLASLDGHVVLRDAVEGSDPAVAGRDVARRLLDTHGGAALLEAG